MRSTSDKKNNHNNLEDQNFKGDNLKILGNRNGININNIQKSTINESIAATLNRDFMKIKEKIVQIALPNKPVKGIFCEWDLWGPLLFCIILGGSLAIVAPYNEKNLFFTLIFLIFFGGSIAISLNIKLLGGKISFFQIVSIIGYCIFPLSIASVISIILRNWFLKSIYVSLAFIWSGYKCKYFIDDLVEADKSLLAIYPIFNLYFFIAWIIIII